MFYDLDNLFFLVFLLLGIIIIGGITVRGILKRKERKPFHSRIFLSQEDFFSQIFFLYFISFLWLTCYKLFTLKGGISPQTVFFFVSLIGILIGYFKRVFYLFCGSILALVYWWFNNLIDHMNIGKLKGVILLSNLVFIGMIFYLLGNFWERKKNFKRVSVFFFTLGILFILGITFFLSIKPGLEALEGGTKGKLIFVSWQVTLSSGLIFLIFLILLFFEKFKNLISREEILALSFLGILFIILPFLSAQKIFVENFSSDLTPTGFFWAIFFNLLIFLEILGLLLLGYKKQEIWMVNTGTIFFSLLIFVKYFDWFFKFLDKSVFFIGAGILLLILGWGMEKGRKYMIAQIKEKKNLEIEKS